MISDSTARLIIHIGTILLITSAAKRFKSSPYAICRIIEKKFFIGKVYWESTNNDLKLVSCHRRLLNDKFVYSMFFGSAGGGKIPLPIILPPRICKRYCSSLKGYHILNISLTSAPLMSLSLWTGVLLTTKRITCLFSPLSHKNPMQGDCQF